MKRLLFFVCLLSVLLSVPVAAQSDDFADLDPGQIVESQFIATHEMSEINNLITGFYEADQVMPARYAVDEYQIRFRSVYRDGEPIVILAQFFVPRVSEVEDFPVYVMGAGSSGLDDRCAPSREQPAVQNWGSYKLFLMSIATQGYITMLPDYAGFNDPDRIQPYYVAEMAGRVLLDGARAAYNWFDTEAAEDVSAAPQDAVILSGYSQGGQSIFAAKDMWQTYAPEIPLAGVVGYAPVTNMQSHMLNLPQMAPYRMFAYADYYGADQVPLDEIFADLWLPTLEEDVLSKCVFEAAGYFSANPAELYRPEFLEALRKGTLEESYPTLAELLNINNPGFVQNEVPALIVQGTEDTTIPMSLHEKFVEGYCGAGNRLTEAIYPGVSHFHVREHSYRTVLDWMATVAAGESPREDCP